MADEAQIDENPDADEESEEGEEGAAKKKKLKLIIIAAAALVLLLGVGGGAYLLLFSGGGAPQGEKPVAVVQTYFYDLPQMVVNLSTTDNKDQFLKLTVSLELANQSEAGVIETRIARVMDAFQVYLRELRPSDLEGSAGIYRLKEELRRRVNLAVYPVQVLSILFKEILVQ